MSEFRWLRTEWMKPMPRWDYNDEGRLEKRVLQFLRAVRSDGQMFVVWDYVGPEVTRETLRARLDTMLDAPALEPQYYEETDTWSRPLVPLNFGKGRDNWIEEPEP